MRVCTHVRVCVRVRELWNVCVIVCGYDGTVALCFKCFVQFSYVDYEVSDLVWVYILFFIVIADFIGCRLFFSLHAHYCLHFIVMLFTQ